MTDDAPSPLLQLAYRPDLNILVGRWGYQPAPHELPAVYKEVQELALEHNCRFWLQDIRRRTLNDPATTRWLLQDFFPGMARRLGGRLYIAYLVGPALHDSIVNRPDYIPAEASDEQPFAVSFFGDEGAAMQWLQARPADAPVG
ncbi:hypothetical protein MON38_10745 [Hymenobacter sp. DH14]|uniref:STAS/SEC14 domain-containing protein n=1 Tax=Hymenobacter cyanobacteriorum TaxID=2926463 RepID=A0A9X2AGP6_9BACT|nr:hypothetical protein [Hymenobacter cyanobacteriorum]MCI1187898.1 hypothetical protein [Hymenobacter cyanobacteriorum]